MYLVWGKFYHCLHIIVQLFHSICRKIYPFEMNYFIPLFKSRYLYTCWSIPRLCSSLLICHNTNSTLLAYWSFIIPTLFFCLKVGLTALGLLDLHTHACTQISLSIFAKEPVFLLKLGLHLIYGKTGEADNVLYLGLVHIYHACF